VRALSVNEYNADMSEIMKAKRAATETGRLHTEDGFALSPAESTKGRQAP